jgi:hypothetical protein
MPIGFKHRHLWIQGTLKASRTHDRAPVSSPRKGKIVTELYDNVTVATELYFPNNRFPIGHEFLKDLIHSINLEPGPKSVGLRQGRVGADFPVMDKYLGLNELCKKTLELALVSNRTQNGRL